MSQTTQVPQNTEERQLSEQQTAVIQQGDKLTMITRDHILVCKVVSIRQRTNGVCCSHQKAVKVEACCSPEAAAELKADIIKTVARAASGK